jgi:mRNA interferase HigB
MHVLSRKRLNEAAEQHSGLEGPLESWNRIAKKAKWASFAEVRDTWRSTVPVGKYTVFNIKSSAYRLITDINFRTGRVFIRHVQTQSEYDRKTWEK